MSLKPWIRTSVFSLIVLAAGSCGVSDEPETFVASPQVLEEVEVTTLPIGSLPPPFRLPGVDGKFHTLAEFSEAPVLAVIFTCNHCPTAQAYEDRIKGFVAEYEPKGVATVAISPNSPLGVLYEELGYTDLDDTYEDMKVRARDHGFNFPYLYDGDDQQVTIAYGPVATPHAFVFDQERHLRYVGRLDGSEKPGTGHAEDLRAAVDAVLAGREVTNPTTKSFGCSIKWSWKTSWREKVNREWAESPVNLEPVDSEGVRALLSNDSDKLRLINVWATWCGPCVIEYPEFIAIHRMFKDRGLEFVSLSADTKEKQESALKFLQQRQSAVHNLIFSEDDRYALIEAVDPEWDGALPYTVLVEPGGRVAYRKQGAIDPLELKRAIVEHPMIGRYY